MATASNVSSVSKTKRLSSGSAPASRAFDRKPLASRRQSVSVCACGPVAEEVRSVPPAPMSAGMPRIMPLSMLAELSGCLAFESEEEDWHIEMEGREVIAVALNLSHRPLFTLLAGLDAVSDPETDVWYAGEAAQIAELRAAFKRREDVQDSIDALLIPAISEDMAILMAEDAKRASKG